MGISEFRINYRLKGFAITYQGYEIIGVDLKYGMTKLSTVHGIARRGYVVEPIYIVGVDEI